MHKSLRPPVITIQLLTDLLFDWVRETHRKTINMSMTDYVLPECEKRITEAEGLDPDFLEDTISLRMAYMQNVSVTERKQIIADVKAVYKLRSLFVHHGQRVSIDESELLKRFKHHAVLSLMALIPIAASTTSKNDFFDD